MINVPYFFLVQEQAELEIEDESHFLIEANNDAGQFYYLYLKSIYGEVFVYEFGPLNIDKPANDSFHFIFYRMPFSPRKIESTVSTFINNPKRFITQCREIPVEKVVEILPELCYYIHIEH